MYPILLLHRRGKGAIAETLTNGATSIERSIAGLAVTDDNALSEDAQILLFCTKNCSYSYPVQLSVVNWPMAVILGYPAQTAARTVQMLKYCQSYEAGFKIPQIDWYSSTV